MNLAPVAHATVHDGFWADRLRVNRERTIPHGFDQLRRSGTLDNLRLAAGMLRAPGQSVGAPPSAGMLRAPGQSVGAPPSAAGASGTYQALTDTSGATFPFLDSDVYKWLEAVGWEQGRGADPGLAAAADEAIGLVAAAQRADGYLNSYVEVVGGGTPYRDLAWGHEFYCIGHLIQAAVAWHHTLGDNRLLDIAVRAADHIDRGFGPTGRSGVDGHPGIEMALVELTRVTGDRRYLTLAARMLELRGHGLLGVGRFGSGYWQDQEPVRKAATVAGHAVRQLYLDCGAVDVAVELDDHDLLAAVVRRWHDLVRTRTYLTGGMGSRHRDEAFGDPYELPPDRAYAETCAAIASVMLAWRLLLATGEPGYADAIERAMYNGVLSGISATGTGFFYVNPLQRRTQRASEPSERRERAPWYPCACCPPNLMRLLSSWERYLATSDSSAVHIHQYAAAEVTAGDIRLSVRTDYPWDGRVTVHIVETPERPWTLSLRVPRWCTSATLDGSAVQAGRVERHRAWTAGDTVVLDLPMPVRVTEPDPRIDAVRGCVAVERGPLVYCVESADVPAGVQLEDLRWDSDRQPGAVPRPDLGNSVVGVEVPVRREPGRDPTDLIAGAIPYHAWANRGVDGMRVWIPR